MWDVSDSYVTWLIHSRTELIERIPPPGGGFLFTMFPDQEPGERGPPMNNCPQNFFFRGGPFSTGSWLGNMINRKPPRGWGGSFDQYGWVLSHIWMCHVTLMDESCHTYQWVMSHIWMSHIWMSHVKYMDESCHTYKGVTSHVWMRHVAHMHTSCHTYEWVISHV